MKRYLSPLNIVFATEIIIVVLASLGLIPHESVLFLTGLLVFYMIFSPLEDALWLTVASIPLFVALPITENFDTLANWRVLITVLTLCLFFKHGIFLSLIKGADGKWHLKENHQHYTAEYLAAGFLLVALLSILVAPYKFLALKKLLFLVNIFLLFLIIRNIAKNKEAILKIWQAAAVGGLAVIIVALIQLITVLFVPLFTFWQFWATKVISVFYGQNLAHLLSYSNTWFAYYAANPPTLRIFSVFPDSHSFAMFLILSLPIFLGLAIFFAGDKKMKIFWWVLAILALLGVVLSGSRGAWASVVPVAVVAAYILRKKFDYLLSRRALATFLIFGFLFLISLLYPPLLYQFQSWQTGQQATTSFEFLERVKSISDTAEVSNKGRLEIWQASIKSLLAHPFLGVGLGNYVKVLDQDVSAAKKGASAHNLYLDFATEIGIFGALILIAMFVDILATSWLVFRRAQEPHFKFFGLLFGLYFFWVLGYSFFDVVLLNDKVLLFFMVGAATLYSIRNIALNPEKINR